MGFYPTKISREDLRDGDHLVVNRSDLYTHHGIYLQDVKRVFHQTRDGGTRYGCSDCKVQGLTPKHAISMSCVSCFLRGERKIEGTLRRFEYGANFMKMMLKNGGSCSTKISDNVEDVKDRVLQLYNSECGVGQYNLLFNNCEAFAIYAKTGIYMKRSLQLMRGGASGAIGGAGCLPRCLLYMAYVGVLGGYAVIPIAGHVAAHRLRVYRVDKGYCLWFSPKKMSVEDVLEKRKRSFEDGNASTLGTVLKTVGHLVR